MVNFIANVCFNPSQVQFTPELLFDNVIRLVMFQSLTGSIHTGVKGAGRFVSVLFQSLTGSIHTWHFDERKNFLYYVSIPHRFNSHWVAGEKAKICLKFQSLTGSIHTLSGKIFFSIEELFQSLTGSIHTYTVGSVILFLHLVSIPHRFNSHFCKKCYQEHICQVSIPHRFNSHYIQVIISVKFSTFQSLTGSIHTIRMLF